MKAIMSKRVLAIVIPIVVVAALIGGAIFALPMVLGGPINIQISSGPPGQATATDAGHGSAKAAASHGAAKEAPVTLPYGTKERVVNLADKGASRYLKIEIVLDVVQHVKPGEKALKGEAAKKATEELVHEMSPYKAKIEDAITSVLTSKTAEELMTTEGKQKLRDELRARLDRISDEHPIAGVYFTQFIIQ